MSELLDSFQAVCRDSPSRTLIVARSEGRALTAREIWNEYVSTRETFRRLGLGPGALLLSLAGNRSSFAAVLLACFDLGITLMPVDRSTAIPEVTALATAYGAGAVVAPAGLHIRLAHTAVPLAGGLLLALLTPQPPRGRYPDTGLLKLTSGSSGLPKAARAAERHIVADARHITAAMDIRPDDVQMAVIPLSHMYGLGNLLLPMLLQGTAMVLREAFAPLPLVQDIVDDGIRVWPGVPFMFDALVDQVPAGALPAHFGRCISAGARLEFRTVDAFARHFHRKIHSFYGSTETGGITFDDSPRVKSPVPVGRPLGDVQITLRPIEQADLPSGSGRVHVRSSAVSHGYVDETQPGEGFVDGGYLTGDLGFFDADDDLVLCGRMSSFVNVAGRKVQPDEIEQLLRTMPGVAEVSVVGAPDDRRGQVLVACIVRATPELGPMAVRTFLAERVAPHKIPRDVVFIDEIPRTDRGKVDRQVLAALARQGREGSGSGQ
jgi:long-chain acyl-CoA synthetase